ncbi:CynX/NimT family MFS transporter [Pediococcus siamensis]|uniref:CynX/NimT family MFS transporter n=1 Tax=Pediococcus siamensis TaxID=381829 RepID=UPI00399F704D
MQKHSQFLTLSMMLVAANMRLPITMMPSLIQSFKSALNLPNSLAGMLTTIPLITFAVISPIIAKLARRFGNEWVIYVFLVILALGSYLRIVPTIWALLLGTLFVGIGIDAGNVLIPAVIKDNFFSKISVATSEYTLSMLFVGALGTGITGILVKNMPLALVMGILSLISIVNLVTWLPNLKYNVRDKSLSREAAQSNHASVWKMPLGWVVTLFFGLQALVYYSLLTWMPSILLSQGYTNIQSSNMVTVLQLGGLPFAYLVPAVSLKKYGVASMVWITFIGFVGGILGLLMPIHAIWWGTLMNLLIGFGSGAAFNLAVVFFTNKTTNGFETADLSGMAQSAGYLLAAVGPVLFGYLNNLIQSWTLVLLLAAGLAICLALAGVIINRHKNIYV